MRIASILAFTAALALPVTAFATPKAPKKDPAPTAQHKPVKHHLAKTNKPGDKPIASTPATPAPVTPTPAPNPPMTKVPAK